MACQRLRPKNRHRQQAGLSRGFNKLTSYSTSSGAPTELHLASRIPSSMIICAAFSAIITVGEQVLPEVMVGMIEASTTRNPATP